MEDQLKGAYMSENKKEEPVEVRVDEGRRGFLKIFGAAAVGTAVAGKGVAEAAKLLAAKKADGVPLPDPELKAEEGLSKNLEEETRLQAHPGEEVVIRPGGVHPWNLVIEHRDWENTDREIVVPFVGDNIEVEVPESIKYITSIYVVATEKTPRGAVPPTVTLRRGYSAYETARRSGIRDPWQGRIERTAKVRTLTEDDLRRMDEPPEEPPVVPDMSRYEKIKKERLAKNLRKNFVRRGGMIREDGSIVEFSDEEEI
jgi:hypothetical protein